MKVKFKKLEDLMKIMKSEGCESEYTVKDLALAGTEIDADNIDSDNVTVITEDEIYGDTEENYYPLSFFEDLSSYKTKSLKLNKPIQSEDYADISKFGVKIGCEFVSASVIAQIHQAILDAALPPKKKAAKRKTTKKKSATKSKTKTKSKK